LTIPRSRGVQVTVLLCIALYIVAFGVFTIGRYERYNATAYDLAFYDQVLWNTAHGRFMALSLLGPDGNNFMGHMEPILILLAPVKLILPDVRWILLIQTAVLAAGAWPVYRIALRRIQNPWISVFFSGLYLLYPVIGWANKFDFHPLVFVPLLLLLAFDLFETDRLGWCSVCLFLAMICKEEMGLTVAMFSLYVAIVGKRRVFGFTWAIVGVVFSVASVFVILPMAQSASKVAIQGWASERYSWLLKGNFASIMAYVTSYDTVIKLRFLVQLFAPLAFLPLLRPGILLVAAPTLGLALLSTSLNQSGIYHQYMLPTVPVLFVAAIHAFDPAQRYITLLLRRISRVRPGFAGRLIVILMLTFTLSTFLLYNPFWHIPRDPYSPIWGWEPGASIAALERAKQHVGADGCLVTANNIAAHYSDREQLYVRERFDPPDCRYVLVDMADPRYLAEADKFLCEKLTTGEYWLIFEEEGVVLLDRTPATPANSGDETASLMNRICKL
jgi:uncharacterized membrane protein